jgi:predicted DNA-binding transcriptional regulator AlpA
MPHAATHDAEALSPAPTLDRLITLDELLTPVPVDRSTLWRMRRAGRFPHPVDWGMQRRLAWRASDIAAWLHSREAR